MRDIGDALSPLCTTCGNRQSNEAMRPLQPLRHMETNLRHLSPICQSCWIKIKAGCPEIPHLLNGNHLLELETTFFCAHYKMKTPKVLTFHDYFGLSNIIYFSVITNGRLHLNNSHISPWWRDSPLICCLNRICFSELGENVSWSYESGLQILCGSLHNMH